MVRDSKQSHGSQDKNAEAGGPLAGTLKLGRYFQLVSVAPAAVIVLSVSFLLAAGAPQSSPSFEAGVASLADTTLSEAAITVVLIVIVGMAMHPFQFIATQWLEGYWGSSESAINAMASRSLVHLDRRSSVERRYKAAILSRGYSQGNIPKGPGVSVSHAHYVALHDELAAGQLTAEKAKYPRDPLRTLPTAFGNRLRRYEDALGHVAGGADVIHLGPYMAKVAGEQEVAHVNDARSAMDLAVRFSVAWAIAAILSFALLWSHGAWLVLPTGLICLAFVAYRGAVATADEYGAALWVMFDLNLHDLVQAFPDVDELDGTKLASILEATSRQNEPTA